MASLAELQDALMNADKAGDEASARMLADAIHSLRQKPQAATGGPSAFERISMGMADPIQGGAQLLTKVLPTGVVNAGNQLNNWLADKTGVLAKLPDGGVDQQTRQREKAYQDQRTSGGQGGVDWLRLAGNVASPANLAIATKMPAAMSLGSRMGVGALGGGAASALNPVTDGNDFASEKLKQVGVGAAFGGAVPALVSGVARVISPKASTNPNLNLLKDEGVKPTIGQTLGGWANAAEEKLQSVPILGDAISAARRKALEQFNNAAINRAAGQVGGKVEGTGQGAVQEAGDLIGKAYDDALSNLKFVRFDGQFASDLSQLRSMAQALTPPMRSKFNTTLDNIVGGRTSTSGSMLAVTLKKADSELGQMAGKFGKSSVASEQEFGDAVKQLQALLRQQVARTSPEASAALKAADSGWANLVRVEGAAKAAKNAEGVFTPAQLNMAIQTADNSVRKRAVSRGTALMQDLGNAGQQVLGNKVPDSGTATRLLYGAGAIGSGAVSPLIPGGLLAGAAAYTPPIQALLRALASSRPEQAQAIAEALKKSSPMLGAGGGLLGLEVAQ